MYPMKYFKLCKSCHAAFDSVVANLTKGDQK